MHAIVVLSLSLRAYKCHGRAAQWMSSLRNGIQSYCVFGTDRPPATKKIFPSHNFYQPCGQAYACRANLRDTRRALPVNHNNRLQWKRCSDKGERYRDKTQE
jgi:hypothetical protein